MFLVALTTLLLELTLIRVFDVIWYSNMAYMIITLAMFCFGLAGVYSTIRPFSLTKDVRNRLAVLACILGVGGLLILPVMNFLPFNFKLLYRDPLQGSLYFGVMYFFLAIPFFISGLVFTLVFSRFSSNIQRLYYWDLLGAAIGCLIILPFLPPIGPGGILFLVCGLGMFASGVFSQNKKWTWCMLIIGLVVSSIPFWQNDYIEFREHIEKRGVKTAKAEGAIEVSYWDPVSKIDVIDQERRGQKHIAYDGGTQSSFIYPFDGDFEKLRKALPDDTPRHFGGQNVFISHYFKRDTDANVLVIGAAAGQETKAALTYGANSVDAIELVGFVIKLGKDQYSSFNGNIFNHPKVNAIVGEGRSYLRSTDKKYDIIQMFSNHTSSSIASGTGAMATTYLQTAEAYKEYFNHLTKDGILHINHHIYPKMVTTAALAWKQMGRTDFRDHVMIFQARGHIVDTLPTMLIKMTPWTESEAAQLRNFFEGHVGIVEDPLNPEESFLSDEFYSGTMSDTTLDAAEYHLAPSTDDRPYFNFLRKKFNKKFSKDPGNNMTYSTAAILNKQLKRSYFPRDIIHLVITGIASLVFSVIFIFVPLFFSKVGRTPWSGKAPALIYFSCLGSGFIIFELVFIQIFMKLIGYPLYTYTTVVFAVLLAAATGSLASGKMGLTPRSGWIVPFVGILVTSIALLLSHQWFFEIFLQSTEIVRIIVAILLIFPLGFFLGMPFPLGIMVIAKQRQGAVAWAWAMNGLFTVIGGIASVLLSLKYGFKVTIITAILIYIIAMILFPYMRRKAFTA
ncbi:MAG: hypothetical protein GY705_21510 [Bacteroidetes bacterium]|nr:hypothetical protein [Bacteroidota bacterium]